MDPKTVPSTLIESDESDLSANIENVVHYEEEEPIYLEYKKCGASLLKEIIMDIEDLVNITD